MVESVRALVKQIWPAVTEEAKYGGIIFCAEVSFSGVFAYKKHVSVEFSVGAYIDDNFGFLEGKGQGRRHIKLANVSEVETKQLAAYLPLALAAAKAHCSYPRGCLRSVFSRC
ncbi:DUF1801 domain-containing protein [Shewanella sp. NIFS-20-20]|nr:DUF1801 domain-containing protein [Shewanella sp. NIFS-20-20]